LNVASQRGDVTAQRVTRVLPPRLRATGSADQRTFEAVRAGTDDTFRAMRWCVW